MNKSQKSFIIPALLVIVAVLVIGGGIYYESRKSPVPEAQQNKQLGNAPSNQSSVACENFTELSEFVLKNIQQPDGQKAMEKNPNVITSFHWKRNVAEPFITYPIINGVSAFYGDNKTNHNIDFIVSAIKKDSDALNKTLNTEANSLGLTVNSVNTLPLQSFSNQDATQVFAFEKGESLYSVALTVDSGDHQAPPQGTVAITCGKALDNYDKVYSALNLKADSFIKDPYDNDYVAIGDVSSDNTVYAILGSSNQIRIANYYYFDGKTLKLVSKDSYPTQCAPLESQKVGEDMRCVDANYNQRKVMYSSAQNNSQCVGEFTFPNSVSKLAIGQRNKIAWKMSLGINEYYSLGIDLLNEQNQKLGSIINWNWIKYNPITSADWDTETIYNKIYIGPAVGVQGNPPVYELKPDQNTQLQPGKYKLRLSYTLADSHTDSELAGCGRQGNFESDYFEIVR